MSKIRSMSKIRYEFEDGEIQLIDIPQELLNKIKKDSYNQALKDFRETFADRITHDEEVVYVNSDEYIAVSRGSVKCLVDKLVKELKK